jgi:hypothetical protein
MPRPFFPHTMQDLTHAVDGVFGLVVADMPDGSLWVLKRNRKGAGGYELSQYSDAARTKQLSYRVIVDRKEAFNAMSEVIGLGEQI